MKGTAAPLPVRWVGVSCSRFVSARGLSHGRGPRSGRRKGSAGGSRPACAAGCCPGSPDEWREPRAAPASRGTRHPEAPGLGTPAHPRERFGHWVPSGCLESGPHGPCLLWLLLLRPRRPAAQPPMSRSLTRSPTPVPGTAGEPPEPTSRPCHRRARGSRGHRLHFFNVGILRLASILGHVNIFLKSPFKETPSSEGQRLQTGTRLPQGNARAPPRPCKASGRFQSGILDNVLGSFSTSFARCAEQRLPAEHGGESRARRGTPANSVNAAPEEHARLTQLKSYHLVRASE